MPTGGTCVSEAAHAPCGACRRAPAECRCLEVRDRIGSVARGLRSAGLAAAASGRASEACRLLARAAAYDPSDVTVWEVRGLCSFSIGRVSEARGCWERATALAPTSQAAAWLQEITAGAVADSLRAYNAALGKAAAGDHDEAAGLLTRVCAHLPDFAPAARLQGLVLVAQGRPALARQVWREQLARVSDDAELWRLLAAAGEGDAPLTPPAPVTQRRRTWVTVASAGAVTALLLIVTVLPIRRPETAHQVASLPRAGGAPNVSSQQPPAHRPAEGGLQPRDLTREEPRDTSGAAATPQGREDRRQAGWALYGEARGDVVRGAWEAAVPKLTRAVEYGVGSFYHDDALYLLAQGHAALGRPTDARRIAAALLAQHPSSMFANSVTRAIASTGERPTSR